VTLTQAFALASSVASAALTELNPRENTVTTAMQTANHFPKIFMINSSYHTF
jgi:hypothetical protein